MEKNSLQFWNRLVYYISDVGGGAPSLDPAFHSFAEPSRERRPVSLSISVNSMPGIMDKVEFHRIYPIISAVSVLETYLIMGQNHGFLNDISDLNERLSELKNVLYSLLNDEGSEPV